MTVEEYINPLSITFRQLADPVRADNSKKYLRDQFGSLGITAVPFRRAVKDFVKTYGSPDQKIIYQLMTFLWSVTYREYQHAGIEILRRKPSLIGKKDIGCIEMMITTKSWWDTVDAIAVFICGNYFNRFPEQIIPVTGRWIDSGHLWLMRSALLFQLKYKDKTDTELLAGYINKVSAHKDFFIRKAIGWVLRDYSKKNPEWVRSFVKKYPLSGLSYREATKYL